MKAVDHAFDRFLIAVANRSGRVVAAVALASYGGLGLLVPLLVDVSALWLVAANVSGTSLAAAVVLTWLGLRIRERDRRLLVEWTTSLRLLTAEEFEWFVGEVFRREGWSVEEVGRQGLPDGNVDLMLTKAGERKLVQCKRWTSRAVGVEDVRAFAGTLMREDLPGSAGIFVTTSAFSDPAQEEARAMELELIDGHELLRRVERVRKIEPCPVCRNGMVLGRSAHGWWFRCISPGCAGKRDLGRDAGRAVELLVDYGESAPGEMQPSGRTSEA